MALKFISTIFLLIFIIPRSKTLACYTSIFAFGDSLTDAGNRIFFSHDLSNLNVANPPYGETFFHYPNGRFCDGRIIIDFIAEHYGVAFMPPSASVAGNGSSIEGGVNFAVGGAAAVDSAFYESRGIINPFTNASLNVQMIWFKDVLPLFCDTPSECRKKFKNSLFVVGPFGSNDYRHALTFEKDIEEIRTYIPMVIDTITAAINDLIKLGATTIMVPSLSPDGCLPVILTDFGSANTSDYDPDTGCLSWLNELNEFHNQRLQKRLHIIRRLNPDVVIIYADFYNAVMKLYRNPGKYGFLHSLEACCGAGGAYRYNDDVKCGNIKLKNSCPDPWHYIDWDGNHMTEKANRLVTMTLLDGTYTSPSMNTLCASSPKFTYYD
ncbi:PREDICTED: GDSL esterase/lipase At1g28580-like [Ipomoea nil]|uniref:GDSL esterase/lipase At1g28580-like n=1 Tax=Ipomoea nil TaxID=35883 RepID=UPI00090158C5|nr:PREDICTED: GDSL esterase/lipase At1g28580-like [Ipomoea nil]